DGANETIAGLAADSDEATRRAALRCLAARPAPTVETFARALSDPDHTTRLIAAEALTRRPDPRATDPLVQMFKRGSPEEQTAAIAALRAAQDPAALPALEKAAASRLPHSVREPVEATIIELRKAQAEREARPSAAH